MKKIFLLAITAIFLSLFANAQDDESYSDSIAHYWTHYIRYHEVVKEKDQQYIKIFPLNKAYHVKATVEMQPNSPWFTMNTSGKLKKDYRIYALLHFTINDTALTLELLQSRQLLGSTDYADYLFLPFTDLTTGESTYESGRYIDIRQNEILENNTVWVDFNKAYNPYCAYTTGYNCPIPPRENNLPVAIPVGEKKYGKPH